MSQQLVLWGTLIVFIGFIVMMIGALSGQKSDTKVAVGGFVGFIPFGFANDKRLMYVVTGLMILLAFIFFILPYLLRK